MKLPSTIGKYRLEELVAASSGDVYQATDMVSKRAVMVELLPEGDTGKSGFLERAKAASQMSHDNLIRTLDFGEDAGRAYWARESIEGRLLGQVIASGDMDGVRTRARMGLELGRAVAYLHTRNIHCGELKPERVHVDAHSGRVRLLNSTSSGGQVNFIAGAPYYLAPEQLRGLPAGEPADVYSFGLVVYELLTGKRARNGETPDAVMMQAAEGAIDYTVLEETGVPEGLAQIVREATAAKVTDRPPAMSSVVNRLEKWMSSTEQQDPAPTQAEAKIEVRPVPEVEPAAEAVPDSEPVVAVEELQPIRLSFARAVVVGSVACVLGGLLVGVLGVSIASARFTARKPGPPSTDVQAQSGSGKAAKSTNQ